LAPKDRSGKSNPYVMVQYGDKGIQQQGQKQQTPVDHQTLTPNWDKIYNKKKEGFTFDTLSTTKHTVEGQNNAFKFVYDEKDNHHIKFICMNKDGWKSDDYMGSFEIQPCKTIKYKTYLLEDNSSDAPVDTLKSDPKLTLKKLETKKKVVKEHKHVSGTLTVSVRFYDEKGIEVTYSSE